MIIETLDFGEIEYTEEDKLKLIGGLVGLEEEDEFLILYDEDDQEQPLQWMQSLKNGDLSYVIVNPYEIFSDYDFEVPDKIIEELEIESEEDIIIFTIVTENKDFSKTTTNLAGPIIINAARSIGRQITVDDDRYSTKHYIFKQD